MLLWFCGILVFFNFCGFSLAQLTNQINRTKLIIDDDGNVFDDDDDSGETTQGTNINESMDATLEQLWPLVLENGWDRTKLTDIVTSTFFEQKPLFVRYEAEVALVHGEAFNIEKVRRYGDAIMMLDKKRLQLQVIGNIVIDKVDFTYDYKAHVLGIPTGGEIIGSVVDMIIMGKFSINLHNSNMQLDDLQIISFGDIKVQLKSNAIVRWITEPLLRIITHLFRMRIKTTVSDGIRDYTRKLLNDVNDNDRLHMKEYVRNILPIAKSSTLS